MSRSDHGQDTITTESPTNSEPVADGQLTAASGPVLVVDDAGEHEPQYLTWLESRYDVRHTQSSGDIVAWLEDERPEVVVFDCTESGDTVDSLGRKLAPLEARYQTLLVRETSVSTAAGGQVADECLRAPVDKDRLVDSLKRASLITTYDAIVAELLTLEMRRDKLREGVSPSAMALCADFRRLTIRTVTLLGALKKLYHRLVMRSSTDPLLQTEYDLSPDDFRPHD
jgi:DNA-binding NtrC family response regulator